VEIVIVITVMITVILETVPTDRTLADLRASVTSVRRKTADHGNIQKKSVVDLEINTRNDSLIIRDVIVISKTGFGNTLSLAKVSTRKVFKLLKLSSSTY
jgi:hypothetical protein